MTLNIRYVKPTVSAIDLTKGKVYLYHPDEVYPDFGRIIDDVGCQIYIHAGKETCAHLNDEGYFIPCDKDGKEI